MQILNSILKSAEWFYVWCPVWDEAANRTLPTYSKSMDEHICSALSVTAPVLELARKVHDILDPSTNGIRIAYERCCKLTPNNKLH